MLGLLAAEPRYYEDAAVVGLGPLGLMGVQHLARLARRVVALDVVAERRAPAMGLGATGSGDPKSPGGPGGGIELVRAGAPELPAGLLPGGGAQRRRRRR